MDATDMGKAGGCILTVANACRIKCIGHLKSHTGKVSSVSWSPDGKLIATTSDDKCTIVWDVSTTAQPAQIFNPSVVHTFQSHSTPHTASWNTDGSTLAIGEDDGTFRLWARGMTHAKATPGDSSGPVRNLAWSPDGKHFAAAGDSGIALWDHAEHSVVATLRGHTGAVQAVAFRPDGGVLVSAGRDERARVWDVQTKTVTATLETPRSLSAGAAWRPDGGMLATLSTMGTVRLWRMPAGRLQVEQRPPTAATDKEMEGPAGLGFSPDGTLLVAPRGDGVWVMDVEQGREVALLQGHIGRVRAAAFSPDGKMVASASEDGTARVWGIEAEQGGQGGTVVEGLGGSQTAPSQAAGANSNSKSGASEAKVQGSDKISEGAGGSSSESESKGKDSSDDSDTKGSDSGNSSDSEESSEAEGSDSGNEDTDSDGSDAAVPPPEPKKKRNGAQVKQLAGGAKVAKPGPKVRARTRSRLSIDVRTSLSHSESVWRVGLSRRGFGPFCLPAWPISAVRAQTSPAGVASPHGDVTCTRCFDSPHSSD